MADAPLRLGLIGAGRWGRIFIKTLARMDGIQLARLASTNPDSRALVEDQCRITEDWQDVAGADDLDGVIIATPPVLHGPMTRAAIAAGNPVLVEKPLTLDAGEAHALLDFAESHSAIVHVDHIHLYHPAYRTLKDIGLGMGPIHAIRSGGGDWGPFRADTSILWDRGSHDVAMCLDLLGEKPKTVSARIKETRDREDGPGEALALQLTFPSGITADIELSNLLDAKRRFFAVHFDRETLIYDDVGPDVLVREPRMDDAKCQPPEAQVLDVANTLPLDQALIDFAQAIRKGEADLGGLRLGVDVVEVLSACQLSLRQ